MRNLFTRKVFLSCVTNEFGPHRKKLAHDLQMPNVKVEWQEAFIETGHTTLDKLDGYIQGCHDVIHIVERSVDQALCVHGPAGDLT